MSGGLVIEVVGMSGTHVLVVEERRTLSDPSHPRPLDLLRVEDLDPPAHEDGPSGSRADWSLSEE